MQFDKAMAQTKKKRRRKRRGTQGGRIDAKARRSRPRSREEAKAQARAKRRPGPKEDLPPTWRNSLIRGLFAAAVFAVLLIVAFKRPIGAALIFGAFMLAFYVPAGYFIDMTMWRRRERARIRARSE
jgi:Flp pilus assembly protein TadB